MNTQFLIEKLNITVKLEFQSVVGKIFREIFGFEVKDNGGAPNKPDHEIFYKKNRIFVIECKGFENTKKSAGIRDLDQVIRYSTLPRYRESYGFLVTNTSFSNDKDFLERAKRNKILLLDTHSLEKLIEARNNFLLTPEEIQIILLNSINRGVFLLPLTTREIERTKYFERNYLSDAYIVIIPILETNCRKLGYIDLDQIATLIHLLSKELNFSNPRTKNIIKSYKKILQYLEMEGVVKIRDDSVFWISKVSGEEILKNLKVVNTPYYSNLLRKINR